QLVEASHPDYVPEAKAGIEAPVGQEVEVGFSLKRGLSITGRVLDADGKPARQKMVFARGTGEANGSVRKSGMTSCGGELRPGGSRRPGSSPGRPRRSCRCRRG